MLGHPQGKWGHSSHLAVCSRISTGSPVSCAVPSTKQAVEEYLLNKSPISACSERPEQSVRRKAMWLRHKAPACMTNGRTELRAAQCPTSIPMSKSEAPVSQNVTSLGERVFTEVIDLTMRSLGWALIQYEWCPYERGNLGTDPHMWKCHVRIKAEIRVIHLRGSQGSSNMAGKPSETRERPGAASPQKQQTLLTP